MFYRLLLFLYSLSLVQSSPNGCNFTSRRADCVREGVNAQSMRIKLDYKDYNFTGNNIGSLPREVFFSLKEVEFLILRSNGITEIGSEAFNHNPQLVSIDLSKNKIKTLPGQLLQSNTKLQQFYCEDNNLTTIDAKFFYGLKSLEIVMLEGNQLMSIPHDTFSTNTLMHKLYLEDNQLETAYSDWIRHFNHSNAFELYLDNNPWTCDCRMKQFKRKISKWRWTTNTDDNKHRLTLPHCHYENPKLPVLITEVNKADFKCSPPKAYLGSANCSSNEENCRLVLKEGSPGLISCMGEGFPTPKVQIRRRSGLNISRIGKGKAIVSWNRVIDNYAGEYLCVLEGYDETGKRVVVEKTILVVVQSTSSPTVGIVLGILLVAIFIIGGTYYYKFHYKRRAGYGSLNYGQNSPIYYDVKEEEPVASEVTYLRDDDEQDEEDHYIKSSSAAVSTVNDEKEVLV